MKSALEVYDQIVLENLSTCSLIQDIFDDALNSILSKSDRNSCMKEKKKTQPAWPITALCP